MKQIKFLGVIIFFTSILFIGCKNSSNSKETSSETTELTDAEDKWVSIWNGKDLTGWNTYFNSPFSGFDKTQKGYLGFNNPPRPFPPVSQLTLLQTNNRSFILQTPVNDSNRSGIIAKQQE